MPFKKGQSGNPNGRKKGTTNTSTQELRRKVQGVLHTNYSKAKIARDLKELSPKQRMEFYFKLLDYTLPKPIPVEINNEEKNKSSDFFARIFQNENSNNPQK